MPLNTDPQDNSTSGPDGIGLAQRLKRETHREHVRLEARLNIPRADFTLTQLATLLGRFYGFYLPCEAQLDSLPDDLREKLLPRRKTPLLQQDLERLGLSSRELAALPCCEVPKAQGKAATLGRWYVLEGSTLGGQFLNRWLTRELALEGGAQFFASYGERVGPMWREYRQWLDQSPPAEGDLVIASARETFELLESWLCRPF